MRALLNPCILHSATLTQMSDEDYDYLFKSKAVSEMREQ